MAAASRGGNAPTSTPLGTTITGVAAPISRKRSPGVARRPHPTTRRLPLGNGDASARPSSEPLYDGSAHGADGHDGLAHHEPRVPAPKPRLPPTRREVPVEDGRADTRPCRFHKREGRRLVAQAARQSRRQAAGWRSPIPSAATAKQGHAARRPLPPRLPSCHIHGTRTISAQIADNAGGISVGESGCVPTTSRIVNVWDNSRTRWKIR